jgi:hypothetical protein
VLCSVALEASHPSRPIGWFDVAGLSLGPESEKKPALTRTAIQKWKIIYLQVLRVSLLRVPLTRLLGTFIAICPAGGHIIYIQCLTLGGIFNAVQCNSFTNQLVHALYSEAVAPFAQFRMAVTEP